MRSANKDKPRRQGSKKTGKEEGARKKLTVVRKKRLVGIGDARTTSRQQAEILEKEGTEEDAEKSVEIHNTEVMGQEEEVLEKKGMEEEEDAGKSDKMRKKTRKEEKNHIKQHKEDLVLAEIENTRKTREKYKRLRSAISYYCRGDTHALNESSLSCLRNLFFPDHFLKNQSRTLRQQNANICDLTEDNYHKLDGQTIIEISPSGQVIGPLPGEKCFSRTTEIKSTKYSMPRNIAQGFMGILPLSFSLVKRLRSPFKFFELSNSMAGYFLKYIFINVQASLFYYPILILDTFYLILGLLPMYRISDDCFDTYNLHAVPARYIMAGGFISAFLTGLMYCGLTYLTLGSDFFTKSYEYFAALSGNSTFFDKNSELSTFSSKLIIITSVVSAMSLHVGDSLFLVLKEIFSQIVYVTMYAFFDSGLFPAKTSKLYNIIGGLLGSVFTSFTDAENLPRVKDIVTGFLENLASGERMSISDHRTLTRSPFNVKRTSLFIDEASLLFSSIILSTVGKSEETTVLNSLAKYASNFNFVGSGATGYAKLAKDFVLNPGFTTLGPLSASFTGVFPVSFSSSVVADFLTSANQKLGCSFARKLYDWEQKTIHHHK
jgi:hypothetical protein